MTRRSAFAAIASLFALPARAQTAPPGKQRPQSAEFAVVGEPAVFEINPTSGSLKESVQKGQQLVWHSKENPGASRFQASDISLAFLRSETSGEVKMTFSCNISSLGYLTAEEAKLNIIVRSKGGASLYSWSVGISVKCADKSQAVTPVTHDVPKDVAPNVFANASAVEVAGYTEQDFPGVRVQRCT